MRKATIAGLIAGSVLVSGCDRGKEAAPAAPHPPTSASAPEPLASMPPSGFSRGLLVVKVTGRKGEDLGKPVLLFVNHGDKPIESFDLRVYAYDASGKQARAPLAISKTPVRPFRPRQLRELEIDLGDIPAGATVEAVVPHVVFADKSEWRDDSLAPEQRPLGG